MFVSISRLPCETPCAVPVTVVDVLCHGLDNCEYFVVDRHTFLLYIFAGFRIHSNKPIYSNVCAYVCSYSRLLTSIRIEFASRCIDAHVCGCMCAQAYVFPTVKVSQAMSKEV